ncbi:MAG TPA: trypsin-like peptidase domain-containing protein [Thermoleophilia bacterium]|nr:trypsin-like peptidase domain-containing protein [Thermoleophilia bacterium]
MSEPTTPGGPPEGTAPDTRPDEAPGSDLDSTTRLGPVAASSDVDQVTEQGPTVLAGDAPTLGWGTPPAGWTRLADGSWRPPSAAEDARAASGADPATAPLSAVQLTPYAPTDGLAPAKPVRSKRTLIRVFAASMLLAAGAVLGVGLSRALTQSHPATVSTLQPSGSSGSGSSAGSPFGGNGTAPGGSGSQGSDGLPFGGSGWSGSGSGSNGSGSSSLGSSELNAIAAKVDPALVDITVTDGYQGGQGAATGIVLTSSGLVLTNNHVIDGATSIKATDVGNGQTYTATVLGYDSSHDVALIQLQGASGLTTAQLGDSSKVQVGDTVVALGNAGGAGGTPSAAAGSIVALDQQITAGDQATGSAEQLSGMMATDADIQAGDSGGALVDSSGQVVGINTAGSSSSSDPFGGSSGNNVGFAVPVDTAMSIVSQIQRQEPSSTVHIGATAFLGVELAGSTDQGFGGFGGSTGAGALVAGTLSGSPAAKAGMSAGDTIVSVDGKTIDSADSLRTVLGTHKPGDQVRIGWLDQSGAQHSATVVLATGPAA